MTNSELRKIKTDIQLNPDAEYYARRRADENRAFDAGLHGLQFPDDLVFRGRLAQAWWDGIAKANYDHGSDDANS